MVLIQKQNQSVVHLEDYFKKYRGNLHTPSTLLIPTN
jgi:hypothetical protein